MPTILMSGRLAVTIKYSFTVIKRHNFIDAPSVANKAEYKIYS